MAHGHSDVRHENPFRKSAITGVAVVAEMLTGGLFMENTKMEKQRTSDPYPTIMRRTLSQGVKGFEAGFWPWGFTLGMTKGAVLGFARAFFMNQCLHSGMTQKKSDLISGFAAGAVQGVFMSPILLARTRVNQSLADRAEAAHGRVNSSLFHEMSLSMSILNQSIKTEGVSTLFIGMPTMIFKRSMDWGMRFLIISQLKEYYYNTFKFNINTIDTNHNSDDDNEEKKPKLNNYEQLGCTFLGGSLAVFITMPIDRLMPILQAAGQSKDQSILQIVQAKMGKEGLQTLQRGLVMRVIHCGWHTTWAIFISTKIYDYFDAKV